jgi:ribonuclease D
VERYLSVEILKSDSGADWGRDIMVRKLSNGGSTKF